MEPAPLTRGHGHARTAISRIRSSDVGSAVEEHVLAAGEFAQAASGTADVEALRVLRLLEGHHQRLHEILKFRSSRPSSNASHQDTSDATAMSDPGSTSKTAPPSGDSADRPISAHKLPNQPPTTGSNQRPPPRDLHSSIANNLASARGIPSSPRRRGSPASPALSVDQAGGRMLSAADKKRPTEPTKLREHQEAADRSGHDALEAAEKGRNPGTGTVTPRKPDHGTAVETAGQTEMGSQTGSAEPFQRFFTTFETLISKLSAPLAFAGLPLSGDAASAASADSPAMAAAGPEPERVTSGPDLTRIFSKAALRAVKESHGPNIMGPGGESFYVVPTTGGTISYADILSRAEQERRASADGRPLDASGKIDDDDEPEFVDAREMPQTPSPEKSRHGGSGRTWRFGQQAPTPTPAPATMAGNKTLEELQLENQALKQLSDTLSRRLHMWEVNAQSSSMALQQSLRALTRSPGASDGDRSGGDDGAPSDKLRELEEQLRLTNRELDKVGRENEKLRAVVGRYREKWEKLKEGARLRREGTRATEEVVQEREIA